MKTKKLTIKEKKRSYEIAQRFLKEQYSRNVISLEEYKFQTEFNKGRYGIN